MTPERIREKVEKMGYEDSVVDLMEWFSYRHISDEYVRNISKRCYDLAITLCNELTDNEELYLGLQDLLRAKDSFVRSAIRSQREGTK